jgi:medium-chain acyl-[acyl-carrier-protein] hydrolase
MKSLSSNPWIIRLKPNTAPRVRLFCFPHAGGNASTFRDWVEYCPVDIEVCAIQLPGRGARIFEPPATSLTPIITELLEAFRPYRETPFVLFGHSLGALISFELARKLEARNIPIAHLFVSGRYAPHLSDSKPPIRHASTPEFIDAVRQRYQCIPDEVLQHAEMMNLWLPVLRADITINETYQYLDERLLDCPISCFGGLEDRSVTAEELVAWRDHTSGTFRFRMFPGDHFFIHSARVLLLRVITEDLELSLHRSRFSLTDPKS